MSLITKTSLGNNMNLPQFTVNIPIARIMPQSILQIAYSSKHICISVLCTLLSCDGPDRFYSIDYLPFSISLNEHQNGSVGAIWLGLFSLSYSQMCESSKNQVGSIEVSFSRSRELYKALLSKTSSYGLHYSSAYYFV